jgi:YHS domain-containing protein
MATVIDPVCGMRIEADDAAAIAEYEGQTHYFCSEACRDIFVSEPSAHGAPGPAGTDADQLPAQEVAERAGIGIERLRELVELGLLVPEDGALRRRDVMRARVFVELEAKGLDPPTLASAHASGHLTLGYLESAGGPIESAASSITNRRPCLVRKYPIASPAWPAPTTATSTRSVERSPTLPLCSIAVTISTPLPR